MKEVTIKVFKFEELREEVREKIVDNCRNNWGHDSFYYDQIFDMAKGNEGDFAGLGYLMENLKNWEVDYCRALVKFGGYVDVNEAMDSNAYMEHLGDYIDKGYIDAKYRDEKHLARIMDYISNEVSFEIVESRYSNYTVIYDSPLYEHQNMSLYYMCEILKLLIESQVQILAYGLEEGLRETYEYLDSYEYIAEVLIDANEDYLEDGTVFRG